ncbi:hypothetical protein DRO66_07145 [Candidatus Bathyarchaeota archaeon]|nr:MAG: hypothetical protein DRO66_07145 [Candidatus Bathyarchaeota archaeon]
MINYMLIETGARGKRFTHLPYAGKTFFTNAGVYQGNRLLEWEDAKQADQTSSDSHIVFAQVVDTIGPSVPIGTLVYDIGRGIFGHPLDGGNTLLVAAAPFEDAQGKKAEFGELLMQYLAEGDLSVFNRPLTTKEVEGGSSPNFDIVYLLKRSAGLLKLGSVEGNTFISIYEMAKTLSAVSTSFPAIGISLDSNLAGKATVEQIDNIFDGRGANSVLGASDTLLSRGSQHRYLFSSNHTGVRKFMRQVGTPWSGEPVDYTSLDDIKRHVPDEHIRQTSLAPFSSLTDIQKTGDEKSRTVAFLKTMVEYNSRDMVGFGQDAWKDLDDTTREQSIMKAIEAADPGVQKKVIGVLKGSKTVSSRVNKLMSYRAGYKPYKDSAEELNKAIDLLSSTNKNLLKLVRRVI